MLGFRNCEHVDSQLANSGEGSLHTHRLNFLSIYISTENNNRTLLKDMDLLLHTKT